MNDKTSFQSYLNTYGGIIAVMENGDRYRLYKYDVEFDGDILRFDCGDEEYAIPLSRIHNVEIPKSDRLPDG